jgi:hypothetical protein
MWPASTALWAVLCILLGADLDNICAFACLYGQCPYGSCLSSGWASDLGNGTEYPYPAFSIVPQLHKSCKPYEQMLLQTWNDAGDIANQASYWNYGIYPLQSAMDVYMSPLSGRRVDSGPGGM